MTLEEVTQQLRAREPIFHRPEFGTTRADFERMTASDFHEVGASGRRYTREYILDTLEERHRTPQHEDLILSDFRCQHLAGETYLVTYSLLQPPNRYTQRATIWRREDGEWKIVFHQGTILNRD